MPDRPEPTQRLFEQRRRPRVLAPAKRPKDYLSVGELRMTATGKVRREALPDLVTGQAP